MAEKRPYRHSVGHYQRAPHEPIEPRLSLQWFVKVGPLAQAAGDAVRDGRVVVHPKELEPRWFAWVDNMYDWCISRQLWWGHRIPVWYGPAGEVVCLGPDEEPPAGWTQDDDVLDTWFSSGLWPFSTLGWPDDTPDLRRYYPTSVLVTGYDILFFWVARMMMFGLYAMDGEPPFDTIALHGMVRDEHGKKMSKSAGNTVDPIAWMDQFGTDAVRFALARGANPGTDMPLGEDAVVAARNFTTKLWNATRFALANGATVERPLPAEAARTDADRWILGRLREVREQVDALLDDFQFAKATEALYHFTWGEFCDWYVELAKAQLRADTADGTRAVLGHVLDALLKLLHPVAPFITETLWTALTGGESVVVAPWPVEVGAPVDAAAATRIVDLQKLVTEVRRFRTEQGIPDSRRVAARAVGVSSAESRTALQSLARLDAPGDGFAPTATVEVVLSGGPVHVELDTSGAIDVAAERARLGRDLAAAQKELDTAEKKLGNPKFVEKAPAAVVDGIRTRRGAAVAEIDRVTARLAALRRERGERFTTRTRRRRLPGPGDPDPEGSGWVPDPEGRGAAQNAAPCCARPGRRSRRRQPGRGAGRLLGGRVRGVPRGRGGAGQALAGDADGALARPDRGSRRVAGRPATRLPGRAPDRDERQDLHGADGRRAAQRDRAAHRPVHQPAPAERRRADQHRQPADHAGALCRGLSRRGAVRRPRRRAAATCR